MAKELAEHLQETEGILLRFLDKHTANPRLLASMRYSVSAGGKRIRPLLLLASCLAFAHEPQLGSYQTAAALEMIHTYSLIHDDLPAMDDDDLRRGRKTNHKQFDEATAILAGDALLTEAFHLLSTALIEPLPKILLLQLLTQASGSAGMVAGQAFDLQAEHKQISLEELIQIHRHKTGKLIQFPLMAGGILAQQPEEVIAILGRLGEHLGLAFQIRDDLLDVTSSTEELGKTAGRDVLLEKSTYPGLLGVNGATAALADELAAAEGCLTELADTAADFDSSVLREVLEKFRM